MSYFVRIHSKWLDLGYSSQTAFVSKRPSLSNLDERLYGRSFVNRIEYTKEESGIEKNPTPFVKSVEIAPNEPDLASISFKVKPYGN